MFRHFLVASALALAATAAFAQAPFSVEAREVQGLVTVNTGSTIATVMPGSKFGDGANFVTGAGAAARLVLSNGCELRMVANQSITIDSRRSCEALMALSRGPGAVPLATAPTVSPAIFAGSLVAGLVLLNSGSGGSAAIPTPPGGGGDIPTPPGGGGNIPNPPVSAQ